MMDFENGKINTSRWRSLTRNCDFQTNYRQGAKRVGRLVVAYFLVPDEEQAHPMAPRPDLAWAVVASKKVGNAVARNRAKRLMREARRTGVLQETDTLNFLAAQWGAQDQRAEKNDQREENSAEPKSQSKKRAPGEEPPVGHKIFAGLWIVLVARRNILSATSREVREELDTLLQSP
jgi:ribonuclease P protein component